MSSSRLAAVGLQVLSYLATVGFAASFRPPTAPRDWLVASGIALLIEGLFIAIKEGLFRAGIPPKIVAVLLGFVPDGLINAGGILFFAGAILTFRPVAAILGVAEVDLASPDETLLIALGISLFLGFGLSVAPHILWREWGKRALRGA